MTPDELGRRARQDLDGHHATTPLPAAGSTRVRLDALRRSGRRDLAVARLVEPHLDALAILAEAGRPPRADALYGVWASESSRPLLLRTVGGSPRLVGVKAFCGGATICDAALVTAVDDVTGDHLLVDVDLGRGRRDATSHSDTSAWRTPAFGATATAQVTFDDHPVSRADVIGPPRFYLDRPGFWHGALGPAAVWAGGAEGLVELGADLQVTTPHQLAGLGELRALVWSMQAQLGAAADEADAHPTDVAAARHRALIVRHLVERGCAQVLDVFARTYGPRPLAFDEHVVRRAQELQLYIRQVHDGADLEDVGRGAASP